MNDQLNNNSLTFIALANEYCQLIENAIQLVPADFVNKMLKILPRLYIVASDIHNEAFYSDCEIEAYLTEDVYNQVREIVSQVMGENDVYLEVFVDDMKYSDTPIACSVSENLADLYQEFYNFISSVKDAPTKTQVLLLGKCKTNFRDYWGQTLCNVLRALHMATTIEH